MLDALGASFGGQLASSDGVSAGYRGQIGKRSAWAHAIAHNIEFQPGDVLVSETSAPVWGYNAELERAMVIGEPTSEMRRLFDHTVAAQQVAFDALRPGVTCADVDRAVLAYFEANGLEPYWRQHTGHAIGLRNHEAPFLDAGDETLVEPGMVFTIEPGLYDERDRRVPPFGHRRGHARRHRRPHGLPERPREPHAPGLIAASSSAATTARASRAGRGERSTSACDCAPANTSISCRDSRSGSAAPAARARWRIQRRRRSLCRRTTACAGWSGSASSAAAFVNGQPRNSGSCTIASSWTKSASSWPRGVVRRGLGRPGEHLEDGQVERLVGGDDQPVLAAEPLVQRALRDAGGPAERVDAGGGDPVLVELRAASAAIRSSVWSS